MPSFVPLLSLILLVLVSALAWAAPQQQRPVDRTEAVRVFLDCRSCDENYLRTEITFINYVRDRATADLHILVTTQPTGGGGTEFTLKFIGLGRFQGVEQQLSYVAPQTNTDDETRKALARVLKLGLVRYVADTPLGSQLDVSYKALDRRVLHREPNDRSLEAGLQHEHRLPRGSVRARGRKHVPVDNPDERRQRARRPEPQ
jgi:hypothetical protein